MWVSQRSFQTTHGWWFNILAQTPRFWIFFNASKQFTSCNIRSAELSQSDHSQSEQVLNCLNAEVILHSENAVKADIYYKDTNAHAHPKTL